MPFCPKCGTQYAEGSPFCAKCGYQLSQSSSSVGPQQASRKSFVGIAIAVVVVLVVIVAALFYTTTLAPKFQMGSVAIGAYSTSTDNLKFSIKNLANSPTTNVGVEVNGVPATYSAIIALLKGYSQQIAPGQTGNLGFSAQNIQGPGSYTISVTVTFADGSYQTQTTTWAVTGP